VDILTPQRARAVLLSLYGSERYEKFVAKLNSDCRAKRRLQYWQETMWKGVEQKLEVQAADFETIAALFRVCHVHGAELKPDQVPIVYEKMQLTGSFITAMESLFPHSHDTAYGGCGYEKTKQREVLFCEECRQSKMAWQKQSPEVTAIE
jgi:hypothetical protein